jgi:hypothetical protein
MLFQDMYLPPHRFFPATIYIKDKPNHEYTFFYIPSFNYDIIDFPKSDFCYRDDSLVLNKINATQGQDLVDVGYPIETEKLILKSEFIKDLDFFRSPTIPWPIVSLRFKNAMEQIGITGMYVRQNSRVFLGSPLVHKH